jgi:hypothetical protein
VSTVPVLEKQLEETDETPQPTELDDQLQKAVIDKITAHTQMGKANRMAEVCNARDQRLYFRSLQNFYWSEDRQDVVFDTEDDDSPYDRVFNIYQGYGKIFISTFLGAQPKVRAEADEPFDEASVANTSKANTFERIYRKKNDIADTQMQIARLMWTDGRIVSRTENGPDGVPCTELFGTLETRVSIAADTFEDSLLIEIDLDLPTAKLKADYPDQRGKINSGNGDTYERNARIAVRRQAGADTAIDVQTGQDSWGLATKTWSYLRPEFYEEFSDADRQQLQAQFPAGLCIVRNGQVYLDSYEYDCDQHLDVLHAMPGDGMSRPSIGSTLMPIQDSTNTSMNLIEETFDHGIPTTYYNKETNIDGLNKQTDRPGASRKMVVPKGTTAAQNFFETAAVNPSDTLVGYAENLRGPIAQFAAGTMPAAFGAAMPDQKTASGYAQAKAMALGQMAIVWKPFTSWYTRETTRAVKLASQGENEIGANLAPARPGARPESVRILPGELSGISFTNDSDENFPETWTEKSNKFMGLLQMGGDIADDLLQKSPSNWYFAKQMIGLQELTLPQEQLWEMVLADIAEMEKEPAQPDPSQMPQQAIPGPGQQPAPAPLVSPIQIDTDYLSGDDFATCFNAVKDWLQSSKGRDVKRTNPQWYENVRLYGLQYKQQMDQIAQNNAQPPPPDLPKVQIPYDSLPVSGKIQAAAKAGIQLSPQDIASVVPAQPALPGA